MDDQKDVMKRWISKMNPPVAGVINKMIDEGKIQCLDEDKKLDREFVIVAGREHGNIVGAVKSKCGCGDTVWLSPATQEVIQNNSDKTPTIVCTQCFQLAMIVAAMGEQ
jgi:hypothetical protein